MSDTWIDRDEFIAGQQWKWCPTDSDYWVFRSSDNKIIQYDGDDEVGTVSELGATTFTYELLGEVNSSLYTDLSQYNI